MNYEIESEQCEEPKETETDNRFIHAIFLREHERGKRKQDEWRRKTETLKGHPAQEVERDPKEGMKLFQAPSTFFSVGFFSF